MNKPALSDSMLGVHKATCPACGHHIAYSLLSDIQPLATLGWASSSKKAQSMPDLPLDFVRCIDCGHIFNMSFDYAQVPYRDKPNLMFNKGRLWSAFINDIKSKLVSQLGSSPTVVEIGFGDGSFIHALSKQIGAGRFVGFDPHGAQSDILALEFKAELFDPLVHYEELKPDLIVSRHVLEHLTNPLEFLQSLSFVATQTEHSSLAYFEVPCVDRVLETGRTVDLYYEHNSQFTTKSFKRMLEKSGVEIEKVGHGYDGEVIYAIARITALEQHQNTVAQSKTYARSTATALRNIKQKLSELVKNGGSIAVWGGTGKSAAFINRYDLDAERFPVVVDSDRSKVGTFVPGTGQEIKFRDWLKNNPVDIIIVPPQWRIKDIISEIDREQISCKSVLLEFDGKLVDYWSDNHPYKT